LADLLQRAVGDGFIQLLSGAGQQVGGDGLQTFQLLVADVGALAFSNPNTKNQRLPLLVATSVLAPPRLPRPASPTRFFTTPPPRSASISPSAISSTALHKAASVSSVLRIHRSKWRVLKTRIIG
jgi:hypothetical protein